MTRRGRWTLAGLAVLAALATAGAMRMRGANAAAGQTDREPDGLRFRLSEGKPADGATEATAPVPAERLSDADADKVLARLAAIKRQPGDEADFALREGSLPAPRAGRTIDAPFPPPPVDAAPPAVESGPLAVRRVQPEGDVPLADRITITFSQPMVPVTGQEDAAKVVPATLSPQPPEGRWRWLGTQTLVFEAGSGKRLPMATEYAIRVPAGTKSETGGALAQEAAFTFRTPPARLVAYGPQGEPQRRSPLIWLVFDQAIDPDAVLRTVHLHAGGKEFAVRRATEAEVASSKERRWMLGDAPKERSLLLKPAAELPGDSDVVVTVGPGTPSQEGPRKTDAPQAFGFRTYGPLKVIGSRCGWEDVCRPEMPWQIEFNNPLDDEAFDPAWVSVSPKAPGVRAQVYGNILSLEGWKKGRTTYAVTLASQIKDGFGQTLGQTSPIVFKVGPALPQVSGPGGFVVADPAVPARVVFHSVNTRRVKVRLLAVTPDDWEKWLAWQQGGPRRGLPPGRVALEKDLPLVGEVDEWAETSLALAPALKEGQGNAIVWWEAPPRQPDQPAEQGAAWVQATGIGLAAFADPTDLLVWATDLATGKPARDVELSLSGAGLSAKSGADGMARFALGDKVGAMLVARRGGETAFLPARFWQYEGGGWRRQGIAGGWRWFVFDDRQLYRPGETVHVKGWLREQQPGKTGDLALPTHAPKSLGYALVDSRGNEIARGNAPLHALGGFDVTLALPKTMNLGQAQVRFEGAGGYFHAFNVQEFRRPEFEVSAKNENPGPHVVRGPGADLSVNAKYYAGGPLPGAQATWFVAASPTSYTPPGRGDFTFGRWIPWWGSDEGDEEAVFVGRRIGRPVRGPGGGSQSFSGRTNSGGTHRLHIDFDAVQPARPYSVTAQAAVQDVNRQSMAASASLLVHPSERYVGLRSKRLFVELGKPLALEAIVCDIDGKLDAGREIRFRAARREWGYRRGRWRRSEVDVKEWNVRSGKNAVTTEFTPKEGGEWTVKATILDSKERPNETELTLWVSGGKPEPRRSLAKESVTLIPSKKEYTPGESAEILVQAPFWPAEALVTLRRDGLVKTERIKIAKSSYTLKVPIQEAYLPNIHLQVDLVGAAARTDQEGKPLKDLTRRPAFASGALDLSVSTASRRLHVAATPALAALEPGQETSVAVTVKDASGKPVAGSETAVVVVDESVLALAGWNLADPVAAFYPRRGPGVEDRHLRDHVLLEDPLQVAQAEAASAGRNQARALAGGFGGAMAAPASAMRSKSVIADGMVMERLSMAKEEGAPGAPIRLRENFDALAVFAASVETDAEGVAQVKVKLPDNLTRYRIVAVAVAGAKQVGTAEGALTARLPLMARPSAPRFLNFGDRFDLPVVVQNQTDAPMTVDVAVRATNAAFTDGHGRRVKVLANDRVEVRFPTEAARPGTARFQIAAVAGAKADAAEVSLPVWTPATTEAFATYGVVDQGAVAQPVQAPADAVPQFGGLEVTTTSTALQELTDAYIYLAQYPYGCAEQIASRVLATAALKDVLAAFKAEGMPDPEAMQAAMGRDLKRLEELQNDDGSFGFWYRGARPWPYLGVHVAHAIVRARQKDFAVPEPLWNRSMAYLKAIEQKFPADYPESCRRMITAYALFVRHLSGDSDRVRARRLLAEDSLDRLGPEIVGWMLNVLAGDPASAAEIGKIRPWLNNKVTETAAAAHFAFSYADGDYLVLHSDRRADAVVLDALIADQPKSELIPKLVRGLLDGRKRGAWSGTQENAFVLLALDRYFRVYEGVTPNFVARLWLGEKYAGEGAFKGRTADRVETKVPMRFLLEQGGKPNLIVAKDGPGRLYYRIGMRYAPRSLKLAPADYGFAVKRAYEPIDRPTDVKRDADGTWVVRAGAKVRVRVSLVATTRRYHVALVDPLPAGFEALNPELRGTEQVASEDQGGTLYPWRWGWWRWWEHQNLRDERAEAFTSLLWEGAYEYVYVCRATTPGRFVVPPAKAEEMYTPETFGRSGSDTVRVE